MDSSRFVAFKLRFPNLTPSTNMNPTKNYYADIAVEMISDSKSVSRAISDRMPDCDTDIVVSNCLSVAIAIGAS